jgi:hypothetical protein
MLSSCGFVTLDAHSHARRYDARQSESRSLLIGPRKPVRFQASEPPQYLSLGMRAKHNAGTLYLSAPHRLIFDVISVVWSHHRKLALVLRHAQESLEPSTEKFTTFLPPYSYTATKTAAYLFRFS